jgi:Ca2+-binding EF-hand superfamily protein
MSDTSDYAAAFALIDADGDGLITAPELQMLMRRLGTDLSDEFAAHAVELLDTDGDSLVSLEEFSAYLRDRDAGADPGARADARADASASAQRGGGRD